MKNNAFSEKHYIYVHGNRWDFWKRDKKGRYINELQADFKAETVSYPTKPNRVFTQKPPRLDQANEIDKDRYTFDKMRLALNVWKFPHTLLKKCSAYPHKITEYLPHIEDDKPHLFYFYKTGCGGCNYWSPIIGQLADRVNILREKGNHDLKVVATLGYINILQAAGFQQEFLQKVGGLPTAVHYKNGILEEIKLNSYYQKHQHLKEHTLIVNAIVADLATLFLDTNISQNQN